MKRAFRCVIAGGLLATGMAAGVELPTKVIKPRLLCGIPSAYDYRALSERSDVSTVQSTAGVLDESVPPSSPALVVRGRDDRATLRYFQLSAGTLKVDHCMLSRVNVFLEPNGDYQISFRADQNPRLTGSPADPLLRTLPLPTPVVIKETGHLKRNLFSMRIRFLGGAGPREKLPPVEIGRPALAEISVDPFWVQRGEPEDKLLRGNSELLRKYFANIDRLEVDFSYR